MPVSKKRKKKGKPVGRGEDRLTGLTLQDLINVVAYQEAHPEEAQRAEVDIQDESPAIDFEDPDTQAVIKAVSTRSKTNKVEEENEDGR